MLNKVFLQGRLVADPELRHTSNGVATASFRLAVERDFKDKESGERKADFVSVVTWRQIAENVSRYFTKGRMAIVEGKLQTRDYTDRDGNRRFVTEVVADNVYFGDSKKDDRGAAPSTGGNHSSYGAPPQQAPGGSYGAPQQAYGGYGSYGSNAYPTAPGPDQFADLTDDDGELPF